MHRNLSPPLPQIAEERVRLLHCAARSHSAAIVFAVTGLYISEFFPPPPPATSILMVELEHDSETLARLPQTITCLIT